jgi:hypothetical protein
MDTVIEVPVANKKKPFALACITLILSGILVFAEMISPYVRAIVLDLPMEYVFHFPTLLTHLFIILCILCVAVATFFKKSNIFLIVSLFTLGFAYVCFSMLDVSSLLNAWEYNVLSGYTDFETGLILDYVPYIAAGLCTALAFVVLGITAVIARKKPSALWILSTLLFAVALLTSMFIFGKTVINNFEQLGWALEMWLDYGVGDTSEIVFDFFSRFFVPVLYMGSTLLHFVTSILLGLYLKKIAK